MSLLTTNYLTPTGREEAWRFTPLKRLAGLHDGSIKVADHISLSAKLALPNGVALTVADAAEHPASYTSTDVVTNRIREVVQKVSLLTIAKDVELSEPIHLSRKCSSAPEFSRVVIQAGVNSKSTVIVENTGNGELGEEIEINLAPGASLDLISLQEWERNAVHLAQHHAIVSKDAQFTSYVVSVGGSVVRISPTVEFTGAGSFADLYGVYFATDGQHLEHRIHVNHNVPNAKSRVNYKGALAGDQAHTVWIGDVYIHKGADGTDTYELNRNLLLSDGARADSVPNLEIETGEIVGAGHASTTGRFDDEQLFYLQSRGIPADIARRLVIRGFFAEIINKLKSAELEERLMQRIDDELAKVGE
ncbi:MAG: Fe-S cluster assembly protein SufD [Actinomycetota bacterium]|jgi:Fe-S cluster assembly protein SufD